MRMKFPGQKTVLFKRFLYCTTKLLFFYLFIYLFSIEEEGAADGRDSTYDWGEPSLRESGVLFVPSTGAQLGQQIQHGHLPNVSNC